jgi:hypothetical protein
MAWEDGQSVPPLATERDGRMTETEWLAATNPEAIIFAFTRSKVARRVASVRKLRLFACSCCRRIWKRLKDQRSQKAVVAAEQYADGQITLDDLSQVEIEAAAAERLAIRETGRGGWRTKAAEAAKIVVRQRLDGCQPNRPSTLLDLARLASFVANGVRDVEHLRPGASFDDRSAQLALLRDIFCNPFQPVTVDPASLGASVVALARAADVERLLPSGKLDPDRLAVLAEALEERDAPGAMVEHLQSKKAHVRGCWAVDLCLGLT